MIKKVAILCTLLCVAFVSQAQEVRINITAGTLSEVVNQDFTSLAITGTMDVRDFAYLHDHAMHITAIDLSGVAIAGYDNRNEQYLGYHSHFDAHAIPPSAFFGFTALKEVVLPAGVTAIGEGAFAGCVKLEQVTGAEALQRISDYAFSGCTQLASLPQSTDLKYIGDYAFDKCSSLKGVDLSACEGLTHVGARAFGLNTSLTTIKLPASVQKVGNAAFVGCSALTSVVMPASMVSMGEGVFASCTALSSIDLSGCGVAELPAWSFSGCTQLQSVTLNDNINSIGEGAFYYCTALGTVILPADVKVIDSFAFAGCSGLKDIAFIPEAVETIERYAFYHNTQAGSVYLPEQVSYIGDHAFDGCINAETFLTTREIPAELGDDVFVNMAVEEKTLMVLPESTNIYQSTAQWQDFGVINGAATSVEEVEVAAELQAHFEQYDLVVSSSQAMAEVRLYNVSGVLLSLATPHATHVAIDTRHLVDNVYLLFVTTADGHRQVTKLARIIR